MLHTIVADLRSDTVTRATPAMRSAMAEAEVGDEIREGDPTAQRLEAKAAELTGHEAALFCTSGTMGNLIAFCCHLQPGEEVIAESTSHFLHYESGGIAAIAGAVTRVLPGTGGRLGLDEVRAAIRPRTTHNPRTALLVAENTHNYAGGTVLDQTYTDDFCEIGRAHDIPVHLDGARVWNAAVALGCPVADLTSGCTSVMVDLSKGLGAPYGSLLCSSADFIAHARQHRQRLGGGVRQIGHMAAAGLVALDTMIDRLGEDHEHARRLAEGIHALRPECVELELVETNMVVVHTEPLGLTGTQLSEALRGKGVLCHATGPHRIRLVTHYDVGAEQIAATVDILKPLLEG